MATFIDTHTHLFTEEFDQDRSEMLARAVSKGVTTMLLPNIDMSTTEALKACVNDSNGHCMAMMGLHPSSVSTVNIDLELDHVKNELFSSYPYIGVGEIGIDLYWDKTTIDFQRKAFITQCEWAVELGLAVSIHSRSATYETIKFLKEMKSYPNGVFHCFTGSLEEANEIIKLGFKLGIGGVLTYKNTHLPDVLTHISPDHIVLETDAPYLPPVPYRGKRNESAYIYNIAEKLAEVYQLSIEDIAEITNANARRTFNI
jgi:TatD DNase family protein